MFFHYNPPDMHASVTDMTAIPSHTKIPHTLQNNLFQLPSVALIGPFMVHYKLHFITLYNFSFVVETTKVETSPFPNNTESTQHTDKFGVQIILS